MNTTLNVRIDKVTKLKAQKTFDALGLDMSSAIKLFLKQSVLEQGLPFKPSRTPKEIRAEWDREVDEALLTGRTFSTAKEVLDFSNYVPN